MLILNILLKKRSDMKINSISIKNLFEIFTYDISFKKDENVLIITGPNGFGKTMILNIIFNLFNRKFMFFQNLSFEEITLFLDKNIKIFIKKSIEESKPHISFKFYENNKEIGSFEYSNKMENDIEKNIQRYLPVQKFGKDRWIDRRNDRILSIDDLLNEYSELLPSDIIENMMRIKSEKANEILNSLQVHLIQEQRLFKKAQNVDRNYREEKEQTIMIETIQTYARELKLLIQDYSQKSFIQTQELDSSYPRRLTSENNILTQPEYEKRYEILKNKQKKLTEFGLYESKQEFLNYNAADAKALSVYLKDFELKLGVFDNLLEKLELFTTILNERRFTFKSIKINRTKGF